MKMKWTVRFLIGIIFLAAYELLLDGSGVGMKQRWNKLKDWARAK